jgi:hypothetical protein
MMCSGHTACCAASQEWSLALYNSAMDLHRKGAATWPSRTAKTQLIDAVQADKSLTLQQRKAITAAVKKVGGDSAATFLETIVLGACAHLYRGLLHDDQRALCKAFAERSDAGGEEQPGLALALAHAAGCEGGCLDPLCEPTK